MSVHVFVGPTLPTRDVRAVVPQAVVHPPAGHGDLLRVPLAAGDVAVVIDGYFHHAPSLRHKEILWTLASGVAVVGCGSLGALRAAELAPYGMVGNGVVFDMYRQHVIDADDEVAVAHTEGPEYRKTTTPLVNIRHAVAMAQQHGAVTVRQAADMVAAAGQLHYTGRSWRAIEATLVRADPGWPGALRRMQDFLAGHPEHADVKAADATDTLRRLDQLARPGAGRADWMTSTDWQNRLLHQWRADHSGHRLDDSHVSDGAVIRFQQLYRPDFPQRWQAFALRGIVGDPAPDADVDLVASALAVGAGYGVDARRLSRAQLAAWLTSDELGTLDPRAAVVRVLVRSYRPPRGTFDLLASAADLVTDPAARTAVAEAAVVNAEVAGWGPKHDIEHLNTDVLAAHLGAVWAVSDDRALAAAAGDRGFSSVVEAVEAVRPFYLRHRLTAADATTAGAAA